MGPPWGYLGSLSRDPLGGIFSKCAFLILLNPLVLPLPSKVLGSSKKHKNFPRGCASGYEFSGPCLFQNVDKSLAQVYLVANVLCGAPGVAWALHAVWVLVGSGRAPVAGSARHPVFAEAFSSLFIARHAAVDQVWSLTQIDSFRF